MLPAAPPSITLVAAVGCDVTGAESPAAGAVPAAVSCAAGALSWDVTLEDGTVEACKLAKHDKLSNREQHEQNNNNENSVMTMQLYAMSVLMVAYIVLMDCKYLIDWYQNRTF